MYPKIGRKDPGLATHAYPLELYQIHYVPEMESWLTVSLKQLGNDIALCDIQVPFRNALYGEKPNGLCRRGKAPCETGAFTEPLLLAAFFLKPPGSFPQILLRRRLHTAPWASLSMRNGSAWSMILCD